MRDASYSALAGASEPPSKSTTQALPFHGQLESLRGLAALLVVLYHVPNWNQVLHSLPPVRNGYLMVPLFFVLSGFVIHTHYAQRLHTASELWRFQRLRFFRIYPVHLLFFVLFFILLNGSRAVAIARGIHGEGDAGYRNNWVAVVEQLLMVQAVGPTGNSLSFNSPAWSISVEFYTYLVFGIVSVGARAAASLIHGVIAGGALAAWVLGWLPGFEELTQCLAGFFLGCLAARVTCSAAWHVGPVTTWCAMFGVVAYLWLKPEHRADHWMYVLSAAVIVALVSPRAQPAWAWLNARPLRFLGRISYSIYMCHALVLALLEKLLRLGLHRAALSFWPAVGVVVALLASVVAIAAAVYLVVEQPVMRWARGEPHEARP